MSMNKKQIKGLVIDVLKEIPRGYSEKAVTAIMMIIAHESKGGHYIEQVSGPALGITQIEPTTHDDIWLNGDSISANASIMGITQNVNRLKYDLRYAIFMTRQRLFMDSNPLPSDPIELSVYLKSFWNSESGSANEMSYYNDFNEWR